MNKKNNKSRLESQEKMMNALFELLDSCEIEKITVKMIVKAAKVNRSTFYNNYYDMNDFIDKVIVSRGEKLYQHLKEKNLLEFSYEQQLVALEYLKLNRKEYRLSRKYNSFHDRWIVDSLQSNLLKEYPEQIAEYKMVSFIEGCNGIIYRWMENDFNLDSSVIAGLLVDFYNSLLKKEV